MQNIDSQSLCFSFAIRKYFDKKISRWVRGQEKHVYSLDQGRKKCVCKRDNKKSVVREETKRDNNVLETINWKFSRVARERATSAKNLNSDAN